MQTGSLLPPGRATPQAADLLLLAQNALARACLDTRFKRLVGWRGFAACPELGGASTCRLTRRPGVFGLMPEGCDLAGDVPFARIGLHYFPTMAEPVFESLAPATALLVAGDDYRQQVRDFPAHPELVGPFAIGALTVGLGVRKDVLMLSLETCDHHRIVSLPGIPAADDGWVVPPGGLEQDVPARALAEQFFEVLAAAATLCVGEPPRLWRCDARPAGEVVHGADGEWSHRPCDDNDLVLQSLAWGNGESLPPERFCLGGTERTLLWQGNAGAPRPDAVASALWWRTDDLDALLGEGAHPEAADRRPSLIVLCGFLGSGKTTLVNQIIEHHRNHDSFVAVIQNELGAASVDAHLVEESDSVESLDAGCVCCTLAGSLAKGAQRLIDRYHPERIVLETTGLANPFNLIDELATLSGIVRLDVLVTVVDADNVLDALDASAVARDQIRGGDVLVLNKCDLVDAATLARIRERMRGLNPRAPVLETSFARVHPALLLGEVEADACATPDAPAQGCGAADHDHGDSHGDHAHDHRHPHDHQPRSRHDHRGDGFVAIRLAQPDGLSRDVLFERLESSPGRAFRIKGIVDLADSPFPEALQCVGNRRELAPLPSVYDGPPFLIFIGQDLDAEALHAHWHAPVADAAPAALRMEPA
ncbi:MAG: GTP-binding protein [Rhodoplanes sp.]|uniref:CobW family GTP-binding protein n=1 Tax=Rhodoplanes sp. TaxID=1968906 RepID=UPI00179B3C88|nr:GTP-binding protein [Rhodoplanes sp.]NVO17524.1 GTP-binding protein [Rhodoplanes sp.]